MLAIANRIIVTDKINIKNGKKLMKWLIEKKKTENWKWDVVYKKKKPTTTNEINKSSIHFFPIVWFVLSNTTTLQNNSSIQID